MRSDSIEYGRNADRTMYRDRRYVRCARCGFPCNTDRDEIRPEDERSGWGKSDTLQVVGDQVAYNYDIAYDNSRLYEGSSRTIYDPQVTSGCPHCGTLRYK